MATAKTATTATTKRETCFTPFDKAPLVGAPVAEADAVAVRTPVDENGYGQPYQPLSPLEKTVALTVYGPGIASAEVVAVPTAAVVVFATAPCAIANGWEVA
jgi:hypothetical protein